MFVYSEMVDERIFGSDYTETNLLGFSSKNSNFDISPLMN